MSRTTVIPWVSAPQRRAPETRRTGWWRRRNQDHRAGHRDAPAPGQRRRRTRCPGRELMSPLRSVNHALTAAQAPVEHGVTHVEHRRAFRRFRCGPNRVTYLATAAHTQEQQRWKCTVRRSPLAAGEAAIGVRVFEAEVAVGGVPAAGVEPVSHARTLILQVSDSPWARAPESVSRYRDAWSSHRPRCPRCTDAPIPPGSVAARQGRGEAGAVGQAGGVLPGAACGWSAARNGPRCPAGPERSRARSRRSI
ncbi:UNVERIFIED_CONTAM: hypothetical protein RKD50_009400 [Streptomyces canus]